MSPGTALLMPSSYTHVKVEADTGYVVLDPLIGSSWNSCIHKESHLPIRGETLVDSLKDTIDTRVDDQCILGVDDTGSPVQLWIPGDQMGEISTRLQKWFGCYGGWELQPLWD